MRKRILGITALLAVLAVLSFTACDGLFQEKDDGEPRNVTFINQSAAKIRITLSVGSPSSFTLDKATSTLDDTKIQEVTNTGKDIVLQTISIIDPAMPDPWEYVEVAPFSAIVGGNGKRKDGLSVKSGTIIFRAIPGTDFLPWKVDVLDE